MALKTPSRPLPPFMANTILNFHFDYWHPSLMMCIVPYSLLKSYQIFSPNIALGESKLKRYSSNKDCKQETTTILLLFPPAHYPGQLGPHLQPAKIK